MGNTQAVFHFHEDDGVIDINAASISEARRAYFKLRGHFPVEGQKIEVEKVK